MEELLCHVDVVNCPRRFINQFLETDDLKTGLEGMLDMGPTMVTVTDGANGAAIASRDGIWSRSAFSVDAVDTTGAGDVFCGGLIHGILSDWPADRILPFAMAAAAIKCRGIGNRDALSDVAGIEDLLQRENRKVAPGLVDELSGDTSTRLTSTRGF
jgi:sugar/nucleoside kinase (ribokinase family)